MNSVISASDDAISRDVESGHEFRKERGEAASPPDELVSELQE